MVFYVFLSDLKLNVLNVVVCVKLISRWKEQIVDESFVTRMVLSDEKGVKIEATIPKDYLTEDFDNKIKEDEWYLISDFDVVIAPVIGKNTQHRYHIQFSCETEITATSSKSDSNFFDFKSFDKLKDQSLYDFPVDLYGTISRVGFIYKIPYVANKNDKYKEVRALYFEMVDMEGEKIKCCAIGEYAERFYEEWNKGCHAIWKGSRVFCVLRSWRVSSFKGETRVNSGIGCSKLFLDPDFAELITEKEVCEFTSVFYIDKNPEKKPRGFFIEHTDDYCPY